MVLLQLFGWHLPRKVEGDPVPKHILIVDDSEVVRSATLCGQAVDGLDAPEKVHSLGRDLIILDPAMPRMDGLHAARALRDSKGAGAYHFVYHAR